MTPCALFTHQHVKTGCCATPATASNPRRRCGREHTATSGRSCPQVTGSQKTPTRVTRTSFTYLHGCCATPAIITNPRRRCGLEQNRYARLFLPSRYVRTEAAVKRSHRCKSSQSEQLYLKILEAQLKNVNGTSKNPRSFPMQASSQGLNKDAQQSAINQTEIASYPSLYSVQCK